MRHRYRGGVITLIQRFGSALNLNVHLHMLVLDGVYTEHQGRARFHPVTAPAAERMKQLLDRIITRTLRQLVNQGALVEDTDQPWLNLQDPNTLDQLSAASVRYRIAIGPDTGRHTLAITHPGLMQSLASERSRLPKPFTVNRDGFSLNAAVSIPAHRRVRLEHLCRYLTRPALSLERLSQRPDGRVQWQLKHPFRDGTTHFVFTPEDFIARLAALVPRPQHNLTRYHGVFAPSAALRSRITPAGPGGSAGQQRRRKRRKGHAPPPTPTKANPPDQTSPDQPTAPLTWATRRVTYHSSESSTSTSHSVLIAVNGYGSSPKSRNPISSKPF